MACSRQDTLSPQPAALALDYLEPAAFQGGVSRREEEWVWKIQDCKLRAYPKPLPVDGVPVGLLPSSPPGVFTAIL